MQVPERHTLDHVGVLGKQLKQLRVLVGLSLENVGRTAVAIRIVLGQFLPVLAPIGPPATAQHHIDVQLGDHQLHAQFPHGDQRRFKIRKGM